MSHRLNCAILDDYQDAAKDAVDWSLAADELRITAFREHVEGRARLASALSEFDVVVAMRERTAFDRELLALLPRLRLLVTTGMTNAAIDMASARHHGITVCGTRGSAGPAAELAWGLLLSIERNIPHEVMNLRSGGPQWQLSVGRELSGKTLGVVGLGRLGQRVAAYGRAFGMRVLAWSRNNSPERCAALCIEYAASLDEILANADAVTLHLSLNPETRGIMGARELGLMKPDAVLINTSRGALVDEAALVDVLRTGRIRGAALDVFDREPLPPGHAFRSLPNVIATPHIGYVTRETYRIYFEDALEDIRAWRAGTPLRVLNG